MYLILQHAERLTLLMVRDLVEKRTAAAAKAADNAALFLSPAALTNRTVGIRDLKRIPIILSDGQANEFNVGVHARDVAVAGCTMLEIELEGLMEKAEARGARTDDLRRRVDELRALRSKMQGELSFAETVAAGMRENGIAAEATAPDTIDVDSDVEANGANRPRDLYVAERLRREGILAIDGMERTADAEEEAPEELDGLASVGAESGDPAE